MNINIVKTNPNFKQAAIYAAYILLACLFTAELNVIHSKFLLNINLSAESFIMPTVAGVMFGYLLAKNKLLSEQLTMMAYTDPLTGIYNRLHFNTFLDAEMDKVKRYGGTFSVIFFDIDRFKQINDTNGHIAGDEVLKDITQIVSESNRSSDIFARYGGEEFIIMAASTDIKGAYGHAQRLRKDIEQKTFSVGRVTCSFGVAEFKPESDKAESLIERADNALYKAKAQGRNCVVQA